MAYIAIHEGEQRGAFEVPFQTDAYCRECGERMRVWRESTDGRARHFKHISEMSGGDGGGEGGDSCSGGEGDEHRKWKNFAAERLTEVFDDVAEASVEKRLAAPHTGKKHRDADAIVVFNERDEQLGLGLAVEVQHKNKDKNIQATTRDYLKQDIAVAWLYEDDFSNDGCRMNEVDFRDRAADGISPLYFHTSPVPWYLHLESHVETTLDIVRNNPEMLNRDNCEHELTGVEKHVPAKIPSDWFDEKSREIWKEQAWLDLFTEYYEDVDTGRMRYLSEEYFREVREKLRTEPADIPAKLPTEWYDEKSQMLWYNTGWGHLFRTGPDADSSYYNYKEQISETGALVADGPNININWWNVFPESLIHEWLNQGDEDTKLFDLNCPGCGVLKKHITTQAKQVGIHCSCGITFTVDIPRRSVDESWAR